jgi:glucose/arabinose dehydrogenase
MIRLAAVAVLAAALPTLANGPQSVYEQDLHGLDERHLGTIGEGVPDGVLVRAGYRVDVAADGFEQARFMQFGPDGTLYLSQPGQARILSLKDADGDGTYETRATFVEVEGTNPHSMDWHDGKLWFTASNPGYLMTARDTDGDGVADEVETIIEGGQENGIPGGGGHAFRGVLVHGDEVLVMVTDPGNMTVERDSDRKKVYAFDLDGQNRRVFAGGLRNTEKLRHRIDGDGELTAEVWGADHGSDWIGRAYGEDRGNQHITDLGPPDEFNHIEDGKFYGHPYLMADRQPRPEFVDREDLLELAAMTEPADWSFTAHSATNGFAFLNKQAGDMFGEDHVGDVFQAQHGSWNSSVPVGYAVVRLMFDDATGRPIGELKIVDTHTGVGGRNGVAARPVDCVVAPDGSVLFSCNTTKKIYRISADSK